MVCSFACRVVQLCLAVNNILLMRKRNHAFLLLAIALAKKKIAGRFASRRYSLIDKTIIELGYRKIYQDLSVSRR